MITTSGHLSYCTNIHKGETWEAHFGEIKKYFPYIKSQLSPESPMGIGLRLANEASLQILENNYLAEFQQWLSEENAYVFTMNGFPYGGFHNTVVKDNVHAPDWLTEDRVNYTIRLFNILKTLLPDQMDGGVSTSPLSYMHWFTTKEQVAEATLKATKNMILVIEELINIHQSTGKILHLDIEPEPDGLLETGKEFLQWYDEILLKEGIPLLQSKMGISAEEAKRLIQQHLRLCYDVCHFAIGYENHQQIIEELKSRGIQIGKIQISAALKASMGNSEIENAAIKKEFETFNEPTYLHQVIKKSTSGSLLRFPDLPEALLDKDSPNNEWRAHFHVPIFTPQFGLLTSTQEDIKTVLGLQKENPFTQHLEVETYTWEVIPPELKIPLQDSIVREMQWVLQIINN